MKKSLILAGMLSIGYAYAQDGRVGINTDTPSATLDVKAKTNNGSKVLELQNSEGTKLVTTLDNGNIGIGTFTPERKISIVGDQPDKLGQVIIRTEGASTSNAGITLLSRNAHASIKMGSGKDSDSQIIFDTWENMEKQNFAKTFNIWYDPKNTNESKRYLGFRSNLHPEEQNGMFFTTLGKLGIGVQDPSEKIEAYNPEGFTIIKTSNDLGVSKFGTRDTGNTYVGFKNKFQLWDNDETTVFMDVTKEGSVGIGVIDPTEKLEVNGKIKTSSLAQSGAGDRVVYADENGVLKTGVATAAPAVQVGSTVSMKCDATNRGKMNFVKNDTGSDVFGVCLKNADGNYYWGLLTGGGNLTTGGEIFGQ